MARRKKEQEVQSGDELCMAITPDNLKAVVKDLITNYCIDAGIDESNIPPVIWLDIINTIHDTIIKPNRLLLYINMTDVSYDADKIMNAYNIYKHICLSHNQILNIKGFLDFTGINRQTLYNWNSDSQYLAGTNSSKILNSQRLDIAKLIMSDNEQSLEAMLQDHKTNPMKVLPSLNHWHSWNLPGVSREKEREPMLTAQQLPRLGPVEPEEITEKD